MAGTVVVNSIQMHILRLSIIYFLFIGSLIGQISSNKLSEDHMVLESILKNSKNSTIYHKTITKDQRIPIASFVEDYLLEFYLCVSDVDKTSAIISEEEISFLKERFTKQKVKRIDRLFPQYKSKTTKKHERFKTASISLPVTFRNGTMALFFSLATYGGEFHLLRKKNNSWERICSNSVWTE